MNKTKFIVRVAMCVAILIGGQLALTGIQGLEVVTIMMLCFCWCYGVQSGIAIAVTFSLVRCLIFGFYIDIVVLYLIYYTLFALFFGWLGKRFAGEISFLKIVIVAVTAVAFTACFTMLDNGIKVLIFGLQGNAAKVYFAQSIPTMFTQLICAAVTVSTLFAPLTKVIRKINF